MIKKLSLLVLTIIITLVAVTNPVFARESTDSAVKEKINKLNQINVQLREKLKIKEASREAKIAKMEANILKRFRKFVEQRIKQVEKIIARETTLLDKLHARINAAKNAGKDTTELNKLMTDARAKLADAKTRLATVKTKLTSAEDKESFKTFGSEFGAIYKDLRVVKEDASKMIRLLKGFNSATSESTSSSKVKTGSSSATVKTTIKTNGGTTSR